MVSLMRHAVVFCIISLFCASVESQVRNVRLFDRRKRIAHRRIIGRIKLKPKVCYELVGCFVDAPPHSTFKRPPQHPDEINTRFLLYTRERRNNLEILTYEDGLRSINMSRFNEAKDVKVLIHGYKGSGTDERCIEAAQSLLEVEDMNVIILDWAKGAATSYAVAVANTELVGRQLSVLLLDMISLGTDPKQLHIVGFSLGAHVAGYASEMLKKKNFLIGRITGLDPASPIFKRQLLRERSRKLDISDAHLVDVVHTDGSEVFTDGFGLLKPMGHIDFFPNGGREQPGCKDVKNSVIVTHLYEDVLDISIACSHLRAWEFFVETIKSQRRECKFLAWDCPRGAGSFMAGTCFPQETSNRLQEMGYKADHGSRGIFYLATRAEKPYCGEPLRAALTTSGGIQRTSGVLYFTIESRNSSTTFKFQCNLQGDDSGPYIFYNIAAAEFDAFPVISSTNAIQGSLRYEATDDTAEESTTVEPSSSIIRVDKLAVENRRGVRWEYCAAQTIVSDMEEVNIVLYNKACAI